MSNLRPVNKYGLPKELAAFSIDNPSAFQDAINSIDTDSNDKDTVESDGFDNNL